MRVIYMGTPEFSVPALNEIIAAGHEVVAVYSQPPRPKGRGQKLQPSPVHAFAESQGLTVRTPLNFKDAQDIADFAALDADIAVVAAYGLLLPQSILDAPALGCINLHTSALPRWRGAAPIQRAIMAGDKMTAAQIMQMEAGLDTGPILLSEIVPIDADETTGSLTEKLSYIGADMMPRVLAALSRGGVVPTPQSEEGVTYAKKITPEEAEIDWTLPAHELDNHIRGLSPFPTAWCMVDFGKGPERVKFHMSAIGPNNGQRAKDIGQVINIKDGLHILAGDGKTVKITKLQRQGKAAQNATDFINGQQIKIGFQF